MRTEHNERFDVGRFVVVSDGKADAFQRIALRFVKLHNCRLGLEGRPPLAVLSGLGAEALLIYGKEKQHGSRIGKTPANHQAAGRTANAQYQTSALAQTVQQMSPLWHPELRPATPRSGLGTLQRQPRVKLRRKSEHAFNPPLWALEGLEDRAALFQDVFSRLKNGFVQRAVTQWLLVRDWSSADVALASSRAPGFLFQSGDVIRFPRPKCGLGQPRWWC
jgi:hypothetical protein